MLFRNQSPLFQLIILVFFNLTEDFLKYLEVTIHWVSKIIFL